MSLMYTVSWLGMDPFLNWYVTNFPGDILILLTLLLSDSVRHACACTRERKHTYAATRTNATIGEYCTLQRTLQYYISVTPGYLNFYLKHFLLSLVERSWCNGAL